MKIFNFSVKAHSISICIGILLCASICYGQKSFINKTPTHYLWKGEPFTFSEMEHIFSSNETHVKQYKDIIAHNKTAKTLGLVSLGSVIIGSIIAAKSFDRDLGGLCLSSCPGTNSSRSNQRAGSSIGGLLLFIAVLTALVAIVYKSKGRKMKIALINSYNQELRQLEKPELNLSFGQSTNGIGFTLKF